MNTIIFILIYIIYILLARYQQRVLLKWEKKYPDIRNYRWDPDNDVKEERVFWFIPPIHMFIMIQHFIRLININIKYKRKKYFLFNKFFNKDI